MNSFRTIALFLLPIIAASFVNAAEPADSTASADVIPARPVVPGLFELKQRKHVLLEGESPERWSVVEVPQRWACAETAIIICDMWDDHYCKLSAHRVNEMVPRLNRVLTAARDHGAVIIHSPSGVVDLYDNTPFRQRLKQTPRVQAPFDVTGWCELDPAREPPLPIEAKTHYCDDPVVGKMVKVFDRQHPGIAIIGYDGISDRGDEIFSYFRNHGIKNVVMTGVHTNLCVLGRPFGIRQLVKLGFNVVLARDLTDCMYDPREKPHVSHARGTELVIEHIEKHWCPSIDSSDLLTVVAGTADPR